MERSNKMLNEELKMLTTYCDSLILQLERVRDDHELKKRLDQSLLENKELMIKLTRAEQTAKEVAFLKMTNTALKERCKLEEMEKERA